MAKYIANSIVLPDRCRTQLRYKQQGYVRQMDPKLFRMPFRHESFGDFVTSAHSNDSIFLHEQPSLCDYLSEAIDNP
jgi:hypothetical protein